MIMPTLFKRVSGSIPQGSFHETYTFPPLVVNTVANRYQRGYIKVFPPSAVTRWGPDYSPVANLLLNSLRSLPMM